MNLFVLFFLHISLILGDHEKQRIVQRQDKKKKKNVCWDLNCHYKLSKSSILLSHFLPMWHCSSMCTAWLLGHFMYLWIHQWSGSWAYRCSYLILFLLLESPFMTLWVGKWSKVFQSPCCPINWTKGWACSMISFYVSTWLVYRAQLFNQTLIYMFLWSYFVDVVTSKISWP